MTISSFEVFLKRELLFRPPRPIMKSFLFHISVPCTTEKVTNIDDSRGKKGLVRAIGIRVTNASEII